MNMDLTNISRDKTISDKELILAYGKVLKALRLRGIIRTKNVVGELGERYAEMSFSEDEDLPTLTLSSPNEKEIDARDENGNGYSIKTVTETSAVRTGSIYLAKDHMETDIRFDLLLVVILSDSMELLNIYSFTWSQFWHLKSWSNTQNSCFLSLTKKNLAQGKILV